MLSLLPGRLITSIVLVASLIACASDDLTTCDMTAAKAVVYTSTGDPAYAGQALVATTCGGAGGTCHSEGARLDQRVGAPFHLNYDVALATSDESVERLRRGLATIRSRRAGLMEQVRSGNMPPRKASFDAPTMAGYTMKEGGAALPTLRTAAGKEILRNWLACGAPVVERASGASVGIGDVEPARTVLPDPTWSSIYTVLVGPTCAVSDCHGTAPFRGRLDMSSQSNAYTSLVGSDAMGGSCGSMGYRRVIAGDPDNSLIIRKLEGLPSNRDMAICGERMPLGRPRRSQDEIDRIRMWIQMGALNN